MKSLFYLFFLVGNLKMVLYDVTFLYVQVEIYDIWRQYHNSYDLVWWHISAVNIILVGIDYRILLDKESACIFLDKDSVLSSWHIILYIKLYVHVCHLIKFRIV